MGVPVVVVATTVVVGVSVVVVATTVVGGAAVAVGAAVVVAWPVVTGAAVSNPPPHADANRASTRAVVSVLIP